LPKEQNSTKEPPKKSGMVMKLTDAPKPKKIKKHKKREAKKSHLASKKQKPTYSRRRVPRGPSSSLINSLYGSSYSRMSRSQQNFIDNNLRKIIQISQRTLNYLGYPQEALHFGEQGTNVVEFWLHPNGDITGLKLKRKLPSQSLNRQTIEVIKTAYMYYPHPKTKTKIIIYVRYKLR